MKRYLSIVFLLLSCFLTSCATNHNPAYTHTKVDLSKEGWLRSVDINPAKWTRGADNWFRTGDPNLTERQLRHAPYSAAISTTKVRVPDFTNIKVKGDFQVQIFGTYGKNSVFLYGPNENVRNIAVEVRNGTLCVTQTKPALNMRQAIVRIGVRQLHTLTQLGGGTIEAIRLQSNLLNVFSSGPGHIYLSGNMNLRHLENVGKGCITILGANTPRLDIKTNGTGITNVSGNVGVRSIVHHGKTDINIIGANTDCLRIDADGCGKVGIRGIVNLQQVRVREAARVYVCGVASSSLYVNASDNARIGLSGTARNVYINACNTACVGARDLCAGAAYVRAHGSAHINIAAGDKIFASATDSGSIYFFGTPNIMSQHISGQGSIIPVWSGSGRQQCPVMSSFPHAYKGERLPCAQGAAFPCPGKRMPLRRFKGEG